MRIKTLHVKNFQRHKTLTVSFSPTITSIQGATDAGKSAILRALRWICLNDFGGADFVREGTSEAVVILNFRHQKENFELIRTKGTRVNTYDLNGSEFKSFAKNVPDEVAQVLRLSEINFQGQHDSPFWFQETAGEVSRRLNAVVDLSVIDAVLSTAAATTRDAESTLRVCEQRVAELTEAQEALEPQLNRIEHFEKLKQQNEHVETQAETVDHLASLLAQCHSHTEKLDRLRPQIVAAGALRKRIAAWFQQERQLDSLQQTLNQVANLRQIQSPPDFTPLAEHYGRSKRIEHEILELADLVGEVQALEQTIERALLEEKAAALAFHRATKGERCPLCQNQI